MPWNTPANWVAEELVTASKMNAQVRDNLNYLHGNMPQRGTLWHEEASVQSGNPIAINIETSQAHNMVARQNPDANGDSFRQTVVLEEGTYNFYVLGQQHPNSGKLDWYLDGTQIASGQDWYAATLTSNVIRTITNITVTGNGRHYLSAQVNGKNASSGGYQIRLTKYWFVKTSESMGV